MEGQVREECTAGEVPERRMWTAVLVQALQEWQSGPLRASREAEVFLFQDKEDFERVCQAAGLNAKSLREKLARMPKRRELKPIKPPRLVS